MLWLFVNAFALSMCVVTREFLILSLHVHDDSSFHETCSISRVGCAGVETMQGVLLFWLRASKESAALVYELHIN